MVTSRRAAAPPPVKYGVFRDDVALLIEQARQQSARAVNSVMTATYWLVGRRIVEFEQLGQARAGYGERVIERLSADLTSRFGRGFSGTNLKQFRSFFLSHTPPPTEAVAKGRTPSDRSAAPLLHSSEATGERSGAV